jgi:tetratricopeptide (TPR) repeat protein
MSAVESALMKTDNRGVPLMYFGFYGLVALERGELEKAERIIVDNLALTREAGSAHFEAEVLRVQGQICSAQGLRQRARELFEQAIAIFERLGSRLELGKALYYFGKAQIEWGQTRSGRESVMSALQIFRAGQANYWVMKALELTA